jgi:hypothetical protein
MQIKFNFINPTAYVSINIVKYVNNHMTKDNNLIISKIIKK